MDNLKDNIIKDFECGGDVVVPPKSNNESWFNDDSMSKFIDSTAKSANITNWRDKHMRIIEMLYGGPSFTGDLDKLIADAQKIMLSMMVFEGSVTQHPETFDKIIDTTKI